MHQRPFFAVQVVRGDERLKVLRLSAEYRTTISSPCRLLNIFCWTYFLTHRWWFWYSLYLSLGIQAWRCRHWSFQDSIKNIGTNNFNLEDNFILASVWNPLLQSCKSCERKTLFYTSNDRERRLDSTNCVDIGSVVGKSEQRVDRFACS